MIEETIVKYQAIEDCFNKWEMECIHCKLMVYDRFSFINKKCPGPG